MLVRVACVIAGFLAASPCLAEPMNADMARRFVAGKMFAYNCFDGTRGAGRVYNDGSAAGTVQMRGNGPVQFVTLPAGTLRVKGQTYCAAVRGVPFEPCFNLNKADDKSFRGAVQGLNFAYCDFTRHNNRMAGVRTSWRARTSGPLRLQANAVPADPNN
jgi:hypothetical protein